MAALNELKRHLRPGQVYRREQLAQFSSAVDRHLQQLVGVGALQKVQTGLYYYPKESEFGTVPPDDEKLVEAFLKNDDFFIRSLNAYNTLGVGMTQLYNQKLVYNRKRDGHVTLNGREFYFLKNRNYPKNPSAEFMLVDLMNNLHLLAEDVKSVHAAVTKKTTAMDKSKLLRAVKAYGSAKAQKFFWRLLDKEM